MSERQKSKEPALDATTLFNKLHSGKIESFYNDVGELTPEGRWAADYVNKWFSVPRAGGEKATPVTVLTFQDFLEAGRVDDVELAHEAALAEKPYRDKQVAMKHYMEKGHVLPEQDSDVIYSPTSESYHRLDRHRQDEESKASPIGRIPTTPLPDDAGELLSTRRGLRLKYSSEQNAGVVGDIKSGLTKIGLRPKGYVQNSREVTKAQTFEMAKKQEREFARLAHEAGERVIESSVGDTLMKEKLYGDELTNDLETKPKFDSETARLISDYSEGIRDVVDRLSKDERVAFYEEFESMGMSHQDFVEFPFVGDKPFSKNGQYYNGRSRALDIVKAVSGVEASKNIEEALRISDEREQQLERLKSV